MAAKRADYFAAGTQVVWDVDPVAAVRERFGEDHPKALVPAREHEAVAARGEPFDAVVQDAAQTGKALERAQLEKFIEQIKVKTKIEVLV